MPANPVTPSRVRALIPTLTGSLCERLQKLFQFPQLLFEYVAFKYTESGTFTDEYKEMICALGCTGGGGGGTVNPNMPAPGGVNATDGTFNDKIRVTWNAVTAPAGIAAVTQYKVYRSLATNTDPNVAALVGTVNAPTTTLDDPVDADLVVGSTYNYWVKATNGAQTSAYSTKDVGSAEAPTDVVDAVVDLRATVGFGLTGIALVWTPPAGATKYDIWRHTANDFSAATKIYSGVSPASTSLLVHPTHNPEFWDNDGELVLYDEPPSDATDYYYWVVAKKDSPPGVSDESNSALGRVNPPLIYNGSTTVLDYTNDTAVVPALHTKLWVVLRGGGGGGAGAGGVYGGGGGGGGGTVVEEFTVVPGDTITLVTTGATPDTGNAASMTDGDDGANLELQVNASPICSADGGGGGQYNPAGGGEGGPGASAMGGAPVIYDGKPGSDASGANGGKSGYAFAYRRHPMADALGSYNGDGSPGGQPGSGAKAIAINPTIAVGGHGTPGQAFIAFGT